MTLRNRVESYEEFLVRSLNVVERVRDVFTGVDERLDYLNRTMLRMEQLLQRVVEVGVPAPAAPRVVEVPPGVAPPAPAVPGITLDGRLDTLLQFAQGILDWGRASRGTASEITVQGKFWEENVWRGCECAILAGMGAGQLRTITGNTAEKLRLRPDWAVKPDETSIYAIRARTRLLGEPVARVDRYSGTDTAWQTLVKWTVSSEGIGDLHEVSWTSDNDPKTRMKLLVAGEDQGIPDKQIDSPLTLPFRMNMLPPDSEVELQVKSSDGTAIAVSGSITGAER